MKRRSWMSFFLVLAFVFVSAEKCPKDTHPSAPQPAPPPITQGAPATTQVPDPREGDPEPHPRRIVIFRSGVPEKDLRPYTAIITIPGVIHKEEIVAGPEYNTRVLVPEGYHNYITFEVKPARPGSEMGFCAIESGNQHDGPRFIAKGYRALCSLTLKT